MYRSFKSCRRITKDPFRKGSKVVHSSAFILYLKQQVDTLSKDIEAKDINDLSIKISLDKMKLLSDYFPDVSRIYEKNCQSFSEI
jgi:hypothetical protein